MIPRAIRAALFDVRVYRNLTDDPQHMLIALGIVIISAVAFGLGVRNLPIVNFDDAPPAMVVLLAVSTRLTGWVVWAGIAYILGTLILRGNAGFRQILRSVGIASGPGVFALFFGVPQAGPIIFSVSLIWMFAAGLVAVKETQGFDWFRAFISSAVGWWVAFLVLPAFMLPIVGPTAAAT